MADDNTIIEGTVKFRDGKKVSTRSFVADVMVLPLPVPIYCHYPCQYDHTN